MQEELKQLGNCMVTGKRTNPNQGRVYDSAGICPCLSQMDGGGRQPMIIEKRRIANQVNDDEHRNMVCVDMTINNPQLLDVMNCIPARYDNGVSKRRASGGGVIHIRKLGVSSDTVRCNTLSTRMVKNDSR